MGAQPRLELLEVAAGGAGREDHGDRRLRTHRAARPGRIADAMGMRVIANDTYHGDEPAWPGFRWASVEEVLRESDVVSLHSPLFPETRGMINAAQPGPDEALGVPDQHLARAAGGGSRPGRCAQRGAPRRAPAWTCFRWSRPTEHNPLLSARNCLVTPHIAWATREARSRLMDLAIENIAAFLAGDPRNVVS